MKRGRSRRYDAPLAFADPQAQSRILELEKLLKEENEKLVQRSISSGTPIPFADPNDSPTLSMLSRGSLTPSKQMSPTAYYMYQTSQEEQLNDKRHSYEEPDSKRRRTAYAPMTGPYCPPRNSLPGMIMEGSTSPIMNEYGIPPRAISAPLQCSIGRVVVVVLVGFNDTKDLCDKVSALGGRPMVCNEEACPPQATHVVSPQGLVSLATLVARVSGCWVVNQYWVLDSYNQQQWVDETRYGGRPPKGRSPICGQKIFLTSEFSSAKPQQAQQARYIIEAGQGILCGSREEANIVLGLEESQGGVECTDAVPRGVGGGISGSGGECGGFTDGGGGMSNTTAICSNSSTPSGSSTTPMARHI
ncbi:hypothetical protein Pelo_6321 [Pelomyxa schiedti]|nr:hypothetical protein Pelo_6321 [Pelomyxa schiedti]